jgi:hypothetical protein
MFCLFLDENTNDNLLVYDEPVSGVYLSEWMTSANTQLSTWTVYDSGTETMSTTIENLKKYICAALNSHSNLTYIIGVADEDSCRKACAYLFTLFNVAFPGARRSHTRNRIERGR